MNPAAYARRQALFLATAALACAFAGAACAQDVPRTIKVLVGYPAGAGTDLMARAYADALAKKLKNNVIVENRPGAGGQIAARLLKDARADGSTLLMAIDHQIVMIPQTVRAPGYDPLEDFQPLVQLATYDICAGVAGQSPAKSVAEWAKLAQNDKAQRTVGVPAAGSNAHFIAQAIGRHFGVPFDVVPYKGGSPLITDLSGGHVSAFVMPCGDPILDANQSGRARILLTSADNGHPRAPQASSFEGEGIRLPASSGYFMAVYAHSKLPAGVADALKNASARVVEQPEMSARIQATGMIPLTVAAEAHRANVQRSVRAWGALLQQSGFEPE